MENFRSVLQYIGKTSKLTDYSLLITYVILSLAGLVMIYSASMVPATKGTLTSGVSVPRTYFYNRQLAYVIMSFIIVSFIVFLMNVKLLSNIRVQKGMIITIISLLLLTLVIGKDIGDSESWINLGFMNLQASELLKIATILYILFMIGKKMPRVLDKPKLILSPIVLALGCMFLVFLQRDVGQTLLVLIILVTIIFYLGIGVSKVLRFGMPAALGFLVVFVVVLMAGWLSSYLTARFNTLTNPFQSESGTGYHISSSLLVVDNGGVFGEGLGNSAMRLGCLPEPHTDFTFTIICEELDLVGGLLVITLESFTVYRASQSANKTSSYFCKLVCVGIATYFGSQTFVSTSSISATVPLTGVPLPFISFGGSSVISLSIAMGLLLIVGKQIKVDQRRKKQQQKVDIRRQFS